MNGIRLEWVLWGAGIGAGILILNQILSGRLLTQTAAATARAPVDLYIGATEGLLGLPDPRTPENQSKCDAALKAGNDWEASFYCPASKAIGGWFDGEWF